MSNPDAANIGCWSKTEIGELGISVKDPNATASKHMAIASAAGILGAVVDHKILILDLHTLEKKGEFETPEGGIETIAIAPDGNFLAAFAGVGVGSLKVWDLQSKQIVYSKELHGYGVEHIMFSAQSNRLFATGLNVHDMICYDVKNRIEVDWGGRQKLDTNNLHKQTAALTPDGGHLLIFKTEYRNKRLCLYDLNRHVVSAEFAPVHKEEVSELLFAPDGKHFLSYERSRDSLLCLWRTDSRDPLWLTSVDKGWGFHAAFSADASLFSCVTDFGWSIALHSTTDRSPLVGAETGKVLAVEFSADGKSLYTAGSSVSRWDGP